jgi:hypothetical protein
MISFKDCLIVDDVFVERSITCFPKAIKETQKLDIISTGLLKLVPHRQQWTRHEGNPIQSRQNTCSPKALATHTPSGSEAEVQTNGNIRGS